MQVQGTSIVPKRDDSQPMKTLQYYGSHDIRVKEVGKPMVTDPKDVVLRVTSTCICGSVSPVALLSLV